MLIWLILTEFVHLVNSLPGTYRKIPYDVALPPGDKGESLPPIIMLHALMDWRKTWKKSAPEIARRTGRKVYYYDASNHGESEWSDKVDMSILLLELEQFMQEHNISKAVLVGHSLGGKTAMHFAVIKPEKVEKLIIEDMSPGKLPARVLNMVKLANMFVNMMLKEILIEEDEISAKRTLVRFMEQIFSKEQVEAVGRDFLIEWMPITKRGNRYECLGNIDLFIKMATSSPTEDLDSELRGVFNKEVLFLCGMKSIFHACADKSITDHFPKATLVKFEKGNHMLHFEFIKEFEREVSNFINKQ